MIRWLAVLLVLTATLLAGRSLAARREALREIDRLRQEMYVARVAADSCQNAVAYAEMAFQRFNARVDSVRGEVRDLEALDPRGVPEERYDEYMQLFDAYNDSVATWDDRVARLQGDEAACRTIIDRHNDLADTLRSRLRDLSGGEESETGSP